jgi:hypothetical protein
MDNESDLDDSDDSNLKEDNGSEQRSSSRNDDGKSDLLIS